MISWHAEPEVKLRFDSYSGETRNTDLLVRARDQNGDFLIAVEAKADESFGSSVSSTLAAARERKARVTRSNGEARVNELAAGLLGASASESDVGTLRYQLLTATAGALAIARSSKVGRVILLIQEFRTNATVDAKHATNAQALDRFVERLSSGRTPVVKTDVLYGPLRVPDAALFAAPCPDLYIAKVVRDLR